MGGTLAGMIHALISLIATLTLLVAPLSGAAQAPKRLARVGVLTAGTQSLERLKAFRAALPALGYEEGKNIAIEFRTGPEDRLHTLALELLHLTVDVIVTDSAPATLAAKRATTTTPIVFAATADPVGAGFVKSLARPGGNITGFSEITPELTGKRLQLLKEAAPSLTTVAVVGHPGHAFHRSMVQGVHDVAKQMGLKTVVFEARNRAETERAFAAMKSAGVDAVFMLPHPLFGDERVLIASLALSHRLPSAVTSSERADAGGLMSYGPDFTDQFRRAATYVDKILKGAKPGDLPVEQPTKFQLVINAKTAKALGLELPQSLLLRADRVIQ
ncbi:MAG: ABC transporter substrate-binding protein [Candidatus Rokubacteria bacterium]|nr:ABC transporter substrate-binding protein [Candidatus Rokubacteria bacterium]